MRTAYWCNVFLALSAAAAWLPGVVRADDAPAAKEQPKPVEARLEFTLTNDQEQPKPTSVQVLTEGQGQPVTAGLVVKDEQGAEVKLSDYWLGVEVQPMPEPLAAQLELTAGDGVFVAQVVDGSPAQKAGVKKFDVLVTANDKKVHNVKDLLAVLEDSKGAELNLQLLRSAKKLHVIAKPEKRPDQSFQIKAEIDHLIKAKTDPVQFQFIHPGVVVGSAGGGSSLPDGILLTIKKHEGKARIHVEQGGKSWDANEDELDKLPETLRPHVKAVLGKQPHGSLQLMFKTDSSDAALKYTPVEDDARQIEKKLAAQLDEMSRNVNQMREQLERLRARDEKRHDADRKEGYKEKKQIILEKHDPERKEGDKEKKRFILEKSDLDRKEGAEKKRLYLEKSEFERKDLDHKIKEELDRAKKELSVKQRELLDKLEAEQIKNLERLRDQIEKARADRAEQLKKAEDAIKAQKQ